MVEKKVSVVIWARDKMMAGLRAAGASLKKFGTSVARIGKAFIAAFGAAGAAMLLAARKAEAFNAQLAQIATISNIKMKEAGKAVRQLSAEFGLAKDELTKGLYDALSAGIPSENAFEFMRVAAKTAKAGAASTAESVDLLTTAINAFGVPVEKANAVADSMFTTVRLGKTTIAELGQSFSQVAPLAAASGVAMEEVLAATATLTKQGTPTAQAMTQIRAAIKAANQVLGDGWTKTMSLQDAMNTMSDATDGSTTKLVKMTGRIEGAMAVLGLTGQNAKMAAADLEEVTNAAGAMDEAFQEVERVTPLAKLREALNNMVLTAGDAALKALGPILIRAADGAAEFAEKIEQWADTGVLAAAWESFFETLRHGFAMIGAHVNLAFAAVVDGVERQLPKLKALVLTAFAAAVPTLSNIKAAAEAAKDVVTKTAAITSDRTVAAMAVIEAERKQHADRMTAIVEKQTATQVKLQEEAAKEVVAVQKEAANKVDDIRNNSALKLKQALEKEQKLVEQLAKAQEDIKRKALRKEIRGLEEAQAKRKEMAQKNVAGILAEAEAQKEAAKQFERDEKKALELRKRKARGIKLGRKAEEFLAAFEQIEAARAGIAGGAQAIQGARMRLQLLNKQEKTLKDIKGELQKTRKSLEKLLVRD
jgi:TP901 family phage tail tape measure protein